MSSYDYYAGKERIDEILDNHLEVKEGEIPQDGSFTYDNGYYGWVTAIFVDIRDSSEIFSLDNKEKTSKMIRSFTSEIIEILRLGDQDREIGIRGDCVYAIYNSPKKLDTFDLTKRTFYINTFLKMLNKLLLNKGYQEISAGIGISTAEELVVKAGRKGTGINNKVWIGDAVTKASNLSSLGAKNGIRNIVLSSCTYSNMIDDLVDESGEEAKTWFIEKYDSTYGTYYHSNCIINGFNDWVDAGMGD